MRSLHGVTTGICPLCKKEHPVRKISVGPGDMHVMDKHQGGGAGWCRGEGLAPEQIFQGCA